MAFLFPSSNYWAVLAGESIALLPLSRSLLDVRPFIGSDREDVPEFCRQFGFSDQVPQSCRRFAGLVVPGDFTGSVYWSVSKAS